MGDRLKEKVAVITGAAAGIGAAAVELFAEEGARVVFADLRKENGEATEARMKEKGYDVKFVQTDVRCGEDLENLAKTTLDTYGEINILYNNAGISSYQHFLDMPQETADDILDTNYRSMYRLCKIIVPIMIEQGKGGSIINTSSVAGLRGSSTLVPYSASKGAIRLFTKALAAEVGQYNIRVNSLHPGLTLTEMTMKEPGFAEKGVSNFPLKRGAKPREIAYGALFLASDESSIMTAAELVMDAGATGAHV
jgi:NAD(P)-dependent dehydrogenase (short-subunit alcohol dehydrogenase family)